MGSSAGAKIIYGFPFEGEDYDFDPECSGVDLEVLLARFQGLSKPEMEYENKVAWKEYWDAKRVLSIDIVFDGNMMNDFTNSYLVIRESCLSGDWCGGTKIPIDHVRTPPPEWDELLREFCEKAGVEFKQPEWQLIASYG